MIGSIPVYGDLMLAPMDGYSDPPFRRVCRKCGSAVSYTEFISVRDVLSNHPHVWRKYAFTEAERPVIFQLLDEDPERLLKVALQLQECQPDAFDINMGCPARGISNRGAGAGLLRTPLKAAHIFRHLTSTLSVPVTAKIRLGWDEDDHRRAVLIARVIEECGGAMIAVHGRTRHQGYTGEVDYDAIAAVRQAVKVPVIANGDIKTPQDIERMKIRTDADGVMIGRAAIGNPWIFSRRQRGDVPSHEVSQALINHLHDSLEFYGVPYGLIFFRKHTARYLKPYPIPAEIRFRMITT